MQNTVGGFQDLDNCLPELWTRRRTVDRESIDVLSIIKNNPSLAAIFKGEKQSYPLPCFLHPTNKRLESIFYNPSWIGFPQPFE